MLPIWMWIVLAVVASVVLSAALMLVFIRHIRESLMPKLISQVFGESAARIAALNAQAVQSEQQKIQTGLDRQQQDFTKIVNQLREDINKRQDELRHAEKDRIEKFSVLATSLDEQRKLTTELSLSTRKLSELLDHNQARGQWGERLIEELLRSNGLVEGVHYVQQTPLAGNHELRPDVTLLLPDERFIAVDVKFPFSQLHELIKAESKQDKTRLRAAFLQSLKKHVGKVREYIVPELRTVDVAILFVPSEMIFSYINQECPEVVDMAFASHVMLVSPFTFGVVARTVFESYRNFMMADSLKDTIQAFDEFVSEWEKYRESLQKYGSLIGKLSDGYDDLTGTRTRQLERKINKLREVSAGVVLETGSSQPVLGPGEPNE